jgi:acetyltransferase-like isoleucine patch superfamily enzyme
MADPQVRAQRVEIASDCEFGPDVVIEAEEVRIGPGCRIGDSGADDFRTPGGVRIRVQRLELGAGVQIGRSVRIEGGAIRLDEGVRIARHATLNVREELHIGAHGTLHELCEIGGRRIRIGQELWMLPQAKVGGGSAFEAASSLDIGHYCHLGVDAFVNTARPVRIGHEVGLGTRTSLYSHGAYSSRLMGFPVAFDEVEIGDFSWLPGAIVNPGVRIGRYCVIGVNSLVTSDIPDGALAAGSPARVIRENAFPRPMSDDQRLDFWMDFWAHYTRLLRTDATPRRLDGAVALDINGTSYVGALAGANHYVDAERLLRVANGASEAGMGRPGRTLLDTASRRIAGVADVRSARLTNELRRYGIRFYSRPAREEPNTYVDWESTPPAFD